MKTIIILKPVTCLFFIIICYLITPTVFSKKITYGSAITIEAEEILETNIFTAKPKITADYIDPAKTKKKITKLQISNKINKKNQPAEIDVIWKKNLKLYNSKNFSSSKTAFNNLEDNPKQILNCQMFIDLTSNKTLYLMPPEILGIYDENETKIISAASAGKKIVIKGKFFGIKLPKVFLEYSDLSGKIKKIKCKVDKKSLIYKDIKGKPSAMSIYDGTSQITVELPVKLPWSSSDTSNHNIVLKNKLGIATVIFNTGIEKDRLEELIIPDGFNYETVITLPASQETSLALNGYIKKTKQSENQNVIKGKLVTEEGNIITNALVAFLDGSNVISTTSTDSEGMYEVALSLPADREEVYVRYYYDGAIDGVYIDLQTKAVTPASDPEDLDDPLKEQALSYKILSGLEILPPNFYLMGNYDEVGTPDYLIEREIIDSEFLKDVNESLPQARPLQQMHPEYLASGLEANTILISNADVWITLLHDGSSQCDSLGYFTYQTNNPPITPDNIVSNIIIFPNIQSYYRKKYDKGGLYSGDRVYLGRFPAGTAIGYFVVRRGWWYIRGEEKDTFAPAGEPIVYYSIPALNERYYTNVSSKIKFPITTNFWKHSVLLYYPELKREVLSIETKPQYYWKADVNDAIFYVEANPPDGIDTNNVPVTKKFIDSDSDGISDTFDLYPEDSERAFNNYYPSKIKFSTLAFEDNWPKKGDYDMNDLVIQYNFKYVTDANNKVKDIFAHFKILAVGAGNYNGFGFELGTTPDNIISISNIANIHLSENYISTNFNGTEANQDNATIIVFDNAYDFFPQPSGFINTQSNAPYTEPVEIKFEIHLGDSVSKSHLKSPPYNPFMIADFKNKGRTNEIHLSGFKPTSLAMSLGITNLFGTKDDDSSIAGNKYYLTEENLPWVLNIPTGWDHNYEGENILKSYLKFGTWAQSKGKSYRDWYKDKTGYRIESLIYKKP